MTYQPHGKHIIAGSLVESSSTFQSETLDGYGDTYSAGDESLVDKAAEAAAKAVISYGRLSREKRAAFLNTVADELEARSSDLTDIAMRETALPEARLQGERGRTTGQLRLFANLLSDSDHLDKRQQEALPDRAPVPGPEHKLIQRPIGPVAVFGASNFPLAFSTLGGDTASALAAGCPVVVKGHPAHPGTGEVAADAITAAIEKCDLDKGVFSFIQDNTTVVGTALVKHPLIKAVGFTGSLRGGRALFDLCASRPEPIPFFGEMGSINPVFLLPHAAKQRGSDIGVAWAGSLIMGAGQFCTNPGVVVGLKSTLPGFIDSAQSALNDAGAQPMLTANIANAYQQGVDSITACADVELLVSGGANGREATPVLCSATAEDFMSNSVLQEEVFGPLGIVVTADTPEQMLDVCSQIEGQLTCTLQMDKEDMELAGRLMPLLEQKAGRVLANGFPTGVEVSDAMVHGGPYPASTNFGATSVGTMAIRRFMRPVCYQNVPNELVFDWS
ncbi:MAG: aldehyde dehydrogenase (NADP(+)) [Gammaproteobacteria bacterium]|nr:aldehyde dehydrogenase (NADP(+)) [Gammaproteobacteria bacterium]